VPSTIQPRSQRGSLYPSSSGLVELRPSGIDAGLRRREQRVVRSETIRGLWKEQFAPHRDMALEAQWRHGMDGFGARLEIPGRKMRAEVEGRGRVVELEACGGSGLV
jgi:hypothetical protein